MRPRSLAGTLVVLVMVAAFATAAGCADGTTMARSSAPGDPRVVAAPPYYVAGGARVPLESSRRDLSVRYAAPPHAARASQPFVTAHGPVTAQRTVVDGGVVLLTIDPEMPSAVEEVRRALVNDADVLWAYPALIHPPSGQLLLLTDEILLKARRGVDEAAVRRLLPGGVRVVRPIAADEFVLALTDPKAADPLAVANALAETQPWVDWAQPNFIRRYVRSP